MKLAGAELRSEVMIAYLWECGAAFEIGENVGAVAEGGTASGTFQGFLKCVMLHLFALVNLILLPRRCSIC